MKFAKITDASQNFSQITQHIDAGEDVVLTRKGLPYALITKMSPDDLEDYIVAKHFGVDKLAKEPLSDMLSQEDMEKKIGGV